jgi:transposase
MFIKSISKPDRDNQSHYTYYRLCESYRIGDHVRHRNILNLGLLPELTTGAERKLLADRIEQLSGNQNLLFNPQIPEKTEKLAHSFFKKLREQMSVDTIIQTTGKQAREKEIVEVDIKSIQHEDVKEIGAEWLCYQAIEQLGIGAYLHEQGMEDKWVKTALLHLISRCTYPASEHKTEQWIRDNSGVSELFALESLKISRWQLYQSSRKLYSQKQGLEHYLSKKTNELFDLQDKIVLFDLTNTYFEGRKQQSNLAQFGHSKEKRSDAKLVSLALVVSAEGFLKHSQIYCGNIADCSTLGDIVEALSTRTSHTERKPVVVIDAGIATEDNLKMLHEREYDYLCVTRRKLKEYSPVNGLNGAYRLKDKRGNVIEISQVRTLPSDDLFLHIHSHMKEQKELSMGHHYSLRYEEQLNAIAQAIHIKRGTKRYEKVWERIGRLKERYPSANKHYSIQVESKDGIATSVVWKRLPDKAQKSEGDYFIRTSLKQAGERQMWDIYNTIREVESAFRILKTDLSIRPVFHQKDMYTEAHIFLGIMAYVVVSTIRYQLKKSEIHYNWQNIVRIMNTQKLVTSTMNDKNGDKISVRTCSIPTFEARQIYECLKYKHQPFYRKKFVLPQH